MTLSSQPAADAGLFGPASVSWRVHADPSRVLAGLRALFLQAVHPVAMHGVWTNSDFRADPWGRLIRTAEYVDVTVYGTTREATRAAARVRGMHRQLSGVEPHSGATYRASDPDLLLWVHCCEVESILTTALRCGLRLSKAEQDRYYLEQRRSAALIGLDEAAVPGSVDAIGRYFQDVRLKLRVGPEARAAARFILWPSMPTVIQLATPARPAWVSLASLAFTMLPAWTRRLYSLPGLATTDIAATIAGTAVRRSLLIALPKALRTPAQQQAAMRRLGCST